MSNRYLRQTILPEVGPEGQARLGAATVLVVGAGGLGCAVLQYLTAAGVGRLIILDHDRVEESNLHRQPLYRMSDLGQPKVHAARAALEALNPGTRIEAVFERLSSVNAMSLVSAAEVVIDAADSFAVTYLLSDTCQRLRKPLVSASVLGLTGYVGAFCGGAPSYRAVFPELPRSAGSCAESGVLGTAVGVQPSIPFIAASEVGSADIVIDLRSLTETPVSPFATALRLEVEALENAQLQFPSGARVVLCCRSGVRAWRAAQALQRQGHDKLALLAIGE